MTVEDILYNDNACHKEQSCQSCAQRQTTLFSSLSQHELEFLNSKRYTVNYKKGEVIFKSGTKPLGLNCLHQGKVKIMRTGPAGNDQIVSLRKDGNFIGLRALIKDKLHSTTAVALDTTDICVIPSDIFKKVLDKNPEFCLRITEYFIEKLEDSEQMHVNHSQKHMRARLADALIMIQEIYGENSSGYLSANLKRAEIAALANMTTANAIRILSAFSSENLVKLEGKNIELTNKSALQFLSIAGR